MVMNKCRTISSFVKVAGILTLMSALDVISFFTPTAPIALAATGPVKLCNGDEREETVSAAILYYSHEKRGWIAQGWYNIKPGKCTYVLNYEGGMFVYGYTNSGRTYQGSGSEGFCGKPQGFYGYQKVKCTSSEKFYRGIPIHAPSNGGGFNFTFGDPQLLRDDF